MLCHFPGSSSNAPQRTSSSMRTTFSIVSAYVGLCAVYCPVQNCNIKLIPIFVKQNNISEFDMPVLQTMDLKRPIQLSARCCQTAAKIFLAPFIRASNSIPVPTKTLYADLRFVVRYSSYEVDLVIEECILSLIIVNLVNLVNAYFR